MPVKLPRAFLPLLDTRARYKAYYSGRGCAKSTSFAIAAIKLAAERPVRILCCREVQKTIKESVKYDLDKAITAMGLERMFVSTRDTITSATGAHIIFDGMQAITATKLQSLSDIDIVWVEEAQSISKRSLSTLIPTIRKSGSEIWLAWNPHSAKDPVDAMFRGSGIEDQPVPPELAAFYDKWAVVRQVTRADNPMFPPVLTVEMERDRVRDPDLFRHVWEGEYSYRSDAAVFKNWRVDTMEVPTDARPYYGADWGFSIDPTVLIRVYVFESIRVLYIDAEVSGVGIEIDKTPALFDSLAEDPDPNKDPLHPRNWPIMADSARPETISYMQNHGYPKIERARKGPGSIEEGIEFMRKFDIVVNPNCKRTVNEMTFYSFERDKRTDEVLPKLEDDHNHTIDAARYAVENVRRNLVPTAFPEVVRVQRSYIGDPQPERNPALSPGRGEPPVRGVIW